MKTLHTGVDLPLLRPGPQLGVRGYHHRSGYRGQLCLQRDPPDRALDCLRESGGRSHISVLSQPGDEDGLGGGGSQLKFLLLRGPGRAHDNQPL